MQLHNALQLAGHTIDWQDSMIGPPHNPVWTAVVLSESAIYLALPQLTGGEVNGAEFTSGKGRNKKAARACAAVHALALLAGTHHTPQRAVSGPSRVVDRDG